MAINVPIISQFNSKGIEDAQRQFAQLDGAGSQAAFGIKKSFVPAMAVMGAVGGAAGGAIAAFANFDQKMTESTAIMGDLTDHEMQAMRDMAREIGRTTKFSAAEAAEAFYFLASAGLDAEQSINSLALVADFAQAGNFDMARATDLVTDAQAALGLSSDDAATSMRNMQRLTDGMVFTATMANTSVEQLGEALTEKAGAAAAAAGLEFEDVAATLAVFADQGVKGSAAGTKFTATLAGLQTAARNNKEEMEAFGIQVYDAQGNMRPMGLIIEQMEDAFGGMSTEQRAAALAGLGFNRQALDGLNLLIGNSEAVETYADRLAGAGGTAEQVANKQMETFNAQVGLMKDRVMDVAIGLGENLMPIIQKHLLPALERAADFFERNQKTILIVVGVITALATVLVGLNLILKAVAITQGVLNLVMAANPILLIVLAVMALIAIFIVLQKRFDIVGKAMDIMRNIFTTAKDKVLTAWESVKTFFKKIPGFLTDMGKLVINAITYPYRTAFNTVAKLWNSTIGKFSISIPSWVPVIGGKGFNFPQMPTIPALAEGGIVTRPTLALVGEAGPEAVIPLNRAMGGGMGVTVIVEGSVISEGDLIERVRQGLVESQRGGRRLIA